MNSSPNSSRSYCVTRPEGSTRHARRWGLMVRVGMSGKLHFVIDAGGVEHPLRRRCVGARERGRVGRLAELEKRARQAGLFEHPVTTARLCVIVTLSQEPLSEFAAVRRCDERSLNREAARHQSVPSGYDSSVCLSDARNLSASEPSTMR